MAARTSITILFHVLLLSSKLQPSKTQNWIQAGYWYSGSEYPVSGIDSALFTHLLCAFAYINSSTYELFISSDDEQSFSTFTATVRQRNPAIITLLSIGGGSFDPTIFSSMANTSSHRKSFIDSSIRTARLYGFQGLDLMWVSPETIPDMTNLGTLIQEWREATEAEAAKNATSGLPPLLLTAAVEIFPIIYSATYPVNSMEKNLNWVNVMAL
ncbi:1,4-alpha-glucan-branching enzyme [Parasponia andersonii]|uniref:1,4-alpha-glucan-branching enzyme n=1 Tax=Parasponia andersonii TaxID=3476 RepID=A0A2P5D3T1_PARAD|nr:1,4-alpha-glucan-branching enzyme [Parasponia andersonii]